MARLSAAERAKLPDRAFAYVNSRGERRLPIHDESHVRNALARFDQVKYETPEARERARNRLLKAAKRHGIMPIGFITRELKSRGTDEVTDSADLPNLPEGIVTLLFTDIVGSTALLRGLDSEYESVLVRVRKIIGQSVRRAGGVEIEVRADETFSVFEDAAAAVEAAVVFQRKIGITSFPGDRDVQVRAGIHTGKATLTSNGYIGLAIHKAVRVCSAAHGGQIVVSQETRKKAGDSIAADVRYHSLGRHQLPGLSATHQLYQIAAEGLLADSPTHRT